MIETPRPELNLAQPFTKGNKLLVYNFTEATKARKFIGDIVLAFTQGYNCFQFLFTTPDRTGKKRKFRECVAIPQDAGFDEVDAAEMAKEQWRKFQGTFRKLLAGG